MTPALSYSMNVSLDGYVTDRDGTLDWTEPSDDVFRSHLEQVGSLGAYLLGRKLYEAMLVWETDPSLRTSDDLTAFAETWSALPKVVFSRTLTSVRGNARLATGSVADEVATALRSQDKDVSIGGATLAAEAFRLRLVDELRIHRYPIVLGGGTPHLPPLAERLALDLVETRTFGSVATYERYRRQVGRSAR